jgi:hypothetical protein
MNSRDIQRVLRWYPAAWRRRYGDELIAMVEDTYGEVDLAAGVWMSLIRSGLRERIRMMHKRLRTYTAYSIGCAVIWALILAVVFTNAGTLTRHTVLVFFGGWAIGWLSATIARAVYPPPASHRSAGSS